MSTTPINYEDVIADLEAKKAHIETMITGLRAIAGLGGTLGSTPTPGGGGTPGGGKIASNAFFGKSIPDAAVIHLGNAQRKLSTQELMDAMEAGGLPKSKYNTVYAILRRRESQVGDIVNMQGEWGLASWFPNHTKKPKSAVSLAPKDFEEDSSILDENAEELPSEAYLEPAAIFEATKAG
jgi:hypothetical protein